MAVWDAQMDVHAKGVFLGTKHAIPAMRQAGGGSIINISSIAGLVGNPNGSSAYTATKGAVRLFTKATATQHAKDNIRCNSVHPGPAACRTAATYPTGQDGHCRRRRLRRALSRLGRVVLCDRE